MNTCTDLVKKTHLAVFDFDGTIIEGSSPISLVSSLRSDNKMGKRNLYKVALWAFKYKFKIPQEQETSRQLVFESFTGMTKSEVEEYMASFYFKKIKSKLRPLALKQIENARQAGYTPVLVSASFECLIGIVAQDLQIDHYVGTKMKLDNRGSYTNRMDGEAVEGPVKLTALTQYANSTFGKDSWCLDYSFADHHSDFDILNAAKHPVAISPNKTLLRIAHKNNWEVRDWSLKS